MTRPAKLQIILNNICHNWQELISCQENKNTKFVAVVKANAYGHGAIAVVKALEKLKNKPNVYAVACLEEALQVRKKFPVIRILLLEGVFNKNELKTAYQNNLDLVVHSYRQLTWLEEFWKEHKPNNIKNLENNAKFNIWLKLDSGMGRLGILDCNTANDADIKKLKQKILNLKHCNELIFMTHFANAENRDNQFNQKQEQSFLKVYYKLQSNLQKLSFKTGISLNNSAHYINFGAKLQNENVFDNWVRLGIAIYGINTTKTNKNRLNLKPGMVLSSKIIQLSKKQIGQTVGYGSSFEARRPSLIAIVALGYGDGYPRILSNKSYAYLHHKKVAIIGRVSMDMLALDVTSLQNIVAVDDEVQFWGDKIAIDTIAKLSGTISYELMCGINHRVSREYL